MATQVTVAMTFKDAEGNNESGTVEFRLTHPLLDSSGNLIASQSVNTATLASGVASITLYATNDPTTTPDNLTYEVTEKITGSRSRRYEIELDYATTSVRLEDLSPVSTIPPVYSYALSSELAAIADDYVDKAGDTMTGGLTIASTIFDVRNYGTVDLTGSTDSTTAVQAAITAAAAVGGTVVFPAGTYKITADLTFTNDGATPPRNRPVKLMGAGGTLYQPATSVYSAYGGTIIDYRSGTNACIDTRGMGWLEIEGISFTQQGTAHTLPYIHTTNTGLHVHDCGFVGHSTKATVTCDQDAIVLGGTTTDLDGDVDAAFQGYVTLIQNNAFGRIRSAVLSQVYANANVIRDNVIAATCGSTGNATTSKGAFHFDCGGLGASITGVVIEGNGIEMVGYYYGIRCAALSYNFYMAGNSFYDPGVNSTAGIRQDTGGGYHTILASYSWDNSKYLSDADANCTYITGMQSQTSKFPQPVSFTNTGNGVQLYGVTHVDPTDGNFYIQPTANQSSAAAMLWIRRAATEGSNANARTFQIDYDGKVIIGDLGDANTGATISNAGKTWTANGTGGVIKIDSGTGGSAIDLQGYVVRLRDHAGANEVYVKTGTGSPEGALAAPVGSLYLNVSGGASTTLYVKTSGTGNTGWTAK